MKILGIDPGTATTGYGVINNIKGNLSLVEHGCIRTDKGQSREDRLFEIYQDLKKIIKKHKPEIMAVESLFFTKNAKTAISVAEARGVVLLCARKNNIMLLEFTPLQVKISLTGFGKAEKKQVQFMVKTLLKLKQIPKPDDAADALALAICGSNRKF